MNQGVFIPKRDPTHDEAVWNAWLQKNAEKDRVQFVMMAKIAGIAVVVGVLVLLWAWEKDVHLSQPVPAAANYSLGR